MKVGQLNAPFGYDKSSESMDYDGLKYVKYLPVHYNQMLKLPIEHPEVKEYINNGRNVCTIRDCKHFRAYTC